MTAQILFSTMTGHSKKIAQNAGLKTGLPVYDLKNSPSLPPCDTLFIISGIYSGESKPELISFAKQLSPQSAQQVVLLFSSAKGNAQGSLRSVLQAAGHKVAEETYQCRGNFLLMGLGHPSKTEVVDAAAFIQKFLK